MLLGFGFSCTDESTYPIDFDLVNNSNGGILSQVGFISVAFDRDDAANSIYSIVLEANDRDRGKLFTGFDVFVKYVDRTPTSPNGDGSLAEVPIGSFPAAGFVEDGTTGLPRFTLTITEPAVLAALGLVDTDLEGSDQFIFRHAMNFPDGQVFSSTNVNTAIAAGGGVYKSPFQNVVSIICASDIGGEINYVTTVTGSVNGFAACLPTVSGITHWNVLGPGSYEVEDGTFGQYDCSWDDSPAAGLTLVDACEILSLSGSDQYGLLYTWDVLSNDGTTLRMGWFNDYGDSGYSDLTRTGKTWPLALSF
jgi:hypothetical protein